MLSTQQIHAIDQLFSEWAKSGSPGCALALMHDGDLLYSRGYGMANLEYHIPIQPTTIFHIASISKQFAAAAIALLEQDGLLSADDDVRSYIPELHDFGKTITLRHMIHHTSGLRDQWELLVLAGWRMDDVITTEDILEMAFAQRELNFEPGAEYMYCNTGYTLLGLIVQRVTGKSLREFCAERIFTSLGMKDTHFHDDYLELVPQRAYSYEKHDDGFKHNHLMYSNVGATSLFTTVEDLVLWGQNYVERTVGGDDLFEKMVHKGTFNDGHTIDYAFGVLSRVYKGLPVIEHSGGDAGFRTHLLVFPQQRCSIAVFANLDSINPIKLSNQVADIFLAEHLETLENKTIDLPKDVLQTLEGIYYREESALAVQLVYDEHQGVLCLYDGALEAVDQNTLRRIPAPHIQFTFTPDSIEVLDTITGLPVRYDRVPVYEPTTAVLDELVGAYRSPELQSQCAISIENGLLTLRRRKYEPMTFQPLIEDGYINFKYGVTLLFERDSEQNITSLKWTNGRVRRLHFDHL